MGQLTMGAGVLCTNVQQQKQHPLLSLVQVDE
jgi:hypothetical protein